MKNKKQKQEKQSAKNFNWKKSLNKPGFNFGFGAVFFILIMGLLAFPKYSEFVKTKADLASVIKTIEGDNASGQFFGLKSELKQIEAEYIESKKTTDNLNEAKQTVLDFIFPEEEKINFLTSLLESYATDYDTPEEKFEMMSLGFAKAREPQDAQPTPIGYMVLQINVPIKASEKNFENFITFINNSGSLEQEDFYEKEIPVPLLTIESLNFTYSENPDNSNQQLVNANFVLNTYIHLNNSNVSTTK